MISFCRHKTYLKIASLTYRLGGVLKRFWLHQVLWRYDIKSHGVSESRANKSFFPPEFFLSQFRKYFLVQFCNLRQCFLNIQAIRAQGNPVVFDQGLPPQYQILSAHFAVNSTKYREAYNCLCLRINTP